MKDILKAIHFLTTLKESDAEHYEHKLQRSFGIDPTHERTLITHSVRSAWDLYLQVKNYPKGSEIIFTAFNIPDMEAIIRAHGLVYVPVDTDPYI